MTKVSVVNMHSLLHATVCTNGEWYRVGLHRLSLCYEIEKIFFSNFYIIVVISVFICFVLFKFCYHHIHVNIHTHIHNWNYDVWSKNNRYFQISRVTYVRFSHFCSLLCSWYTCLLYMLTISAILDCQFVFDR